MHRQMPMKGELMAERIFTYSVCLTLKLLLMKSFDGAMKPVPELANVCFVPNGSQVVPIRQTQQWQKWHMTKQHNDDRKWKRRKECQTKQINLPCSSRCAINIHVQSRPHVQNKEPNLMMEFLI